MRSITLIDFKHNKAYTLVENKDMPVDCFAFKKMCLTAASDGRIKVLFVTSDKEMKNTIVEEIVLGRYFMKGLKLSITGMVET